MKTKMDILNEITPELERFKLKFAEAVVEQCQKNPSSSRKWASLRRAAYDFKNELTKLTESSAYRWNNPKN